MNASVEKKRKEKGADLFFNPLQRLRLPRMEEPNMLRMGRIVLPNYPHHVVIRLDADVLEWLKGQGTGYQTRINQLLRQYMQAQQSHRH